MNQDQIIGSNIKLFRGGMGLTQEQLANYLGVDRVELSYFETGSRSTPTTVVTKLANLFGVDEYDLYEENAQANHVKMVLSFRTKNIHPEDLKEIAGFRRIVLNYLKMHKKLADESAHH